MNSYGGGVLGVNVVTRAPANNHEARRPAPTLRGVQPDGAHIASAGRLLDPPAFDDLMDADGNPLDYASVSRGW